MPTKRQVLGAFGEQMVITHCACPKCKRTKTLKRLRVNFKCADVICDFCGYLAQVKASSVKDTGEFPPTLLGAAWKPQKERMDAGIYFPLYVVLVKSKHEFAIYYLPADLQTPDLFTSRKPLSPTAKRSNWQGFKYQFKAIDPGCIVRIHNICPIPLSPSQQS
jgi:type II restriction enzyme